LSNKPLFKRSSNDLNERMVDSSFLAVIQYLFVFNILTGQKLDLTEPPSEKDFKPWVITSTLSEEISTPLQFLLHQSTFWYWSVCSQAVRILVCQTLQDIMATLDAPSKRGLLLSSWVRRKKGGFQEAKPQQAKEKLCWHWQGTLNEAIESFRFEDEDDYGNDILLSTVLFFTTKVSTLISVEGGKALSRSLNHKISNIC